MWPKVLLQLFELLPHVTRLVPMADKYFSSKTASEKATEAAMAAMAEGVRGDLGQVTKAHAGLYRQLQDQSAQITEVAEEVKARQSRRRTARAPHGRPRVRRRLARLWIKAGISLLVILAAVIIGLLVHLIHVR